MPKQKKQKFNTELCTNDMTFDDCELAILRHAVDEAQKENAVKIVQNEEVKRMITIVEEFLKKKKCVCYGGTAINIYYQNTLSFMIERLKFLIMIFTVKTL